MPLAPQLRAFLLVGILGGFTTFSSYAFESYALLRDGQFLAASINIVGQVVARARRRLWCRLCIALASMTSGIFQGNA